MRPRGHRGRYGSCITAIVRASVPSLTIQSPFYHMQETQCPPFPQTSSYGGQIKDAPTPMGPCPRPSFRTGTIAWLSGTWGRMDVSTNASHRILQYVIMLYLTAYWCGVHFVHCSVKREQLAMIAVLMSRQAVKHPAALTKRPLTLDEVLNAKVITPLPLPSYFFP